MNERFTRAAAVAHIDLAHEPEFSLGRLVKVRPSLREITWDGRRDIIDRRVMQVLVALARADGGVVSRDDLIESCWEGVVVGEDAINSCIGRLRKVAEAAGNAFSIETVPRVGYRLRIADTFLPGPQTQADVTPKPGSSASPSGPTPRAAPLEPVLASRTRWIAAVSVVVLSALLAVGIGVWRFWPTRPVQAPVAPVEASVAVLPFVNMSGDPKKEYFSDGFSEELVNDLSNNPHLRVASRTSSFAFKGKNENIGTIARALNVRAVVEGSVREAGDRVRITAQLIDASEGYHLWSAAYDRNLTDILSVQDELARAIAAALTHRLLPAHLSPRPKIDPAVYRLYLEGIHESGQPPPGAYRRAFAIFKQVTARAPAFADGFASLSWAALNLSFWDGEHAAASDLAMASDAAGKALALDPNNIHVRFDRMILELTAWDWRAAALDLRAIQTQDSRSESFLNGARNYYQLMGFPNEAIASWRQLLSSDPHVVLVTLAWAGHFPEALGLARAMIARQSRDTETLAVLCYAYAGMHRVSDARAIEGRLDALRTDSNSRSQFQYCEWSVDVVTGNRADALRLLRIWEQGFPDNAPDGALIGAHYVLLGDFDRASEWFKRAYERREIGFFQKFYLQGFGFEKAFEKYRLSAGYEALAQKPLFKEWQAEHDRIAAALAAHRDPLSLP